MKEEQATSSEMQMPMRAKNLYGKNVLVFTGVSDHETQRIINVLRGSSSEPPQCINPLLQ